MKRFNFILAAFILLGTLGHQDSFAGDRFSKARFLGDHETPWHITANRMTYKEKEAVYIAEGDVVITRLGEHFYAQKAIYNLETGIVEVSGDIRLEAGGDILKGESGSFNLNNHTGKITKGSLFLRENHCYVSGEVMEKVDESNYFFKDCQLTTCDGVDPAWTINGEEVRVSTKYGTVKNATFRVRGMPILYFPYVLFPAKKKRQTGLLPPRLGYSTLNGADMELPFFWAISDQLDATFYQRYMSERGYMQGLEFRYIADKDSKGVFLFDILSDKDDKNMNDPDDMELSPYSRSNDTRYWFRSRVDQNLPHGLVARLDADFVSDQDYLREFEEGLYGFEVRPNLAKVSGRPFEEERSPTRRSALRLGRDTENYSIQALGSYHQRHDDPLGDPKDETAQPIGGLNFNLLPERPFDLPMYFSLESTYDYVWRDLGPKGNSLSLSPEIRFPMWWGNYLEIEPLIRYALDSQWFDDNQGDEEHQTKKAYEAILRVSTNMERVYDINFWNATRLKHRIWPVLAYTYRVPQDEEEPSPWFEPIDQDGKKNLISFSIQNYLDARLEDEKGNITYRQWALFTVKQDYDIDEERRDEDPGMEKEPFRPLSASLLLRPISDLNLRGNVRWDHYENEMVSSDLSLEMAINRSGGRKDRFDIDYIYVRDGQESLNLWMNVNIFRRFSVGTALKRDLSFGENISNAYWVEFKSQCWGARLVGERKDEETDIMLIFQLRGLGEVRAF